MKSARHRRSSGSAAKSRRSAAAEARGQRTDTLTAGLTTRGPLRLPAAGLANAPTLEAAAIKNKRAREAARRAVAPTTAAHDAFTETAPRKSAERSGSFDRTAPLPPKARHDRAAPLDRTAASPSPRLPVRTAMTPRPDILMPGISVENVDWEDSAEPFDVTAQSRWAAAEREMKKRLDAFGIPVCGWRVDMRAGRFAWLDEAGSPVAEARAQVVCTLALPSLVITMGWADPVLAAVSISPIDDMVDEAALSDDESAREIAMRAAEKAGAELVYRMPAPHVDYFLALRDVQPASRAATPGSPVGLVLRGLAELRRLLESRNEPTSELRASFHRVGKSFIDRAASDFKDTEWVGRLRRGGKLVMSLAARLSPPTFTAIAAGLPSGERLPESVAVELKEAIALMEDEWEAFAV